MSDDDAKAFFHLLKQSKDEIEREFGSPLDWQELPGKRASRIAIYKEETDPADGDDWPNQIEWLVDKLRRLDSVFRYRVKNLDPAEWEEAEGEYLEADES